MSKERTLNVAKALTMQLHVTEEAIDTALSEAAQLMEAYVTSRRAVRVSATAVGEVHGSTLKAMMALHAAQTHMTAAHAALSALQPKVGLAAEDIVPPFDKPKDPNDPGNGGISNACAVPALPAN